MLEYNVFEWDGKLFQQLFGTAIGTSCAPPYSGIFMGRLEEAALEEWGQRPIQTLPTRSMSGAA